MPDPAAASPARLAAYFMEALHGLPACLKADVKYALLVYFGSRSSVVPGPAAGLWPALRQLCCNCLCCTTQVGAQACGPSWHPCPTAIRHPQGVYQHCRVLLQLILQGLPPAVRGLVSGTACTPHSTAAQHVSTVSHQFDLVTLQSSLLPVALTNGL